MIEVRTQTKYLFVKSFSWNDSYKREELNGHPLSGRVYKSEYNPNTKHYAVIIGKTELVFDALIATRDYADFEIVELTPENILDFDIKEEDLDLILNETNEEYILIRQGLEELQKAMNNQDREEIEFAQHASETVMQLFMANPLKAEILVELAEYLINTDLDSYSDPSNHLRYHLKYGSGLNMSKALQAIDMYVSENRRTNEDPRDLFVILEACFTELERVYTTDENY